MRTIERSVTITLTSEEIEVITTALHGEYKFLKEERTKSQDKATRLYQRMKDAQRLRNEMGSLIMRTYMGEDA